MLCLSESTTTRWLIVLWKLLIRPVVRAFAGSLVDRYLEVRIMEALRTAHLVTSIRQLEAILRESFTSTPTETSESASTNEKGHNEPSNQEVVELQNRLGVILSRLLGFPEDEFKNLLSQQTVSIFASSFQNTVLSFKVIDLLLANLLEIELNQLAQPLLKHSEIEIYFRNRTKLKELDLNFLNSKDLSVEDERSAPSPPPLETALLARRRRMEAETHLSTTQARVTTSGLARHSNLVKRQNKVSLGHARARSYGGVPELTIEAATSSTPTSPQVVSQRMFMQRLTRRVSADAITVISDKSK
jgi:hypothetical protein